MLNDDQKLVARYRLWMDPKSHCECGHLGDGPHSEHTGRLGHGACQVVGCPCQRFSWARFTDKFMENTKKRLERPGPRIVRIETDLSEVEAARLEAVRCSLKFSKRKIAREAMRFITDPLIRGSFVAWLERENHG